MSMHTLPSGTTPSYTGLVTARSMVFQNPGDTALPKTERYSYDYAGRLTAENGSGMNINYAYDTRGNLLSVEETPQTGLVNAQYDKYSYSYSGDRLTSIGQDHCSPRWHAYGPQIIHIGDWSFSHDSQGRILHIFLILREV